MVPSDPHCSSTIWLDLSSMVIEMSLKLWLEQWWFPDISALGNTNNFVSKVPCSGNIAAAHTAGGEEGSQLGWALVLLPLDRWGGYDRHLSVFFLHLWLETRLDFPWALTEEKGKILTYLVHFPNDLLLCGGTWCRAKTWGQILWERSVRLHWYCL